MQWVIVLLGVVAAVMMVHFHRSHRREMRASRGAMFDRVKPLLGQARLHQSGVGFPTLEGRYRGRAVRLEPIEEHVGFRKVPSLWLRVTVFEQWPWRGVLDFLVRPENIEFYSPIGRLDHRLRVPPGWPRHAWLRTDDPVAMPPTDRLTRYMDFFDDRRAKELLVTGRGVRLVYQCRQAERPYYLVLRSVTFDDLTVDHSEAAALLDRASAIADDRASGGTDDSVPNPRR